MSRSNFEVWTQQYNRELQRGASKNDARKRATRAVELITSGRATPQNVGQILHAEMVAEEVDDALIPDRAIEGPPDVDSFVFARWLEEAWHIAQACELAVSALERVCVTVAQRRARGERNPDADAAAIVAAIAAVGQRKSQLRAKLDAWPPYDPAIDPEWCDEKRLKGGSGMLPDRHYVRSVLTVKHHRAIWAEARAASLAQVFARAA